MSENEVGDSLLGAAMKVHSVLGPGLLESAYETCLVHELGKRGMDVKQQVALPLIVHHKV
jgi:GxxExxY protein